MATHLLRCQGFAIGNYGFTPGRFEAGAPSTFAQLGLQLIKNDKASMPYFTDKTWRPARDKYLQSRVKSDKLKDIKIDNFMINPKPHLPSLK